MKTSILNIDGMGCSGCADSVRSALIGVKGVEKADVDLDSAKAEVTYSEDSASEQDFKQAVSDAGYSVTGIK